MRVIKIDLGAGETLQTNRNENEQIHDNQNVSGFLILLIFTPSNKEIRNARMISIKGDHVNNG